MNERTLQSCDRLSTPLQKKMKKTTKKLYTPYIITQNQKKEQIFFRDADRTLSARVFDYENRMTELESD
jgi:hypothetical protein